jgi:hypothetical protein
MRGRLRALLKSASVAMIVRFAAAVACFVIAIPLLFLPGPAFVFFLAGLVLLGFSVRDIVKLAQAVTPGFSEDHAERVMNHRVIRRLDRLLAPFRSHRAKMRVEAGKRSTERADEGSPGD